MRPLTALLGIFAGARLPPPDRQFFQLRAEREEFLSCSFPAKGNRDGLRWMINDSVTGDTMGVGAQHRDGTVLFAFPSAILSAIKPRAGCKAQVAKRASKPGAATVTGSLPGQH